MHNCICSITFQISWYWQPITHIMFPNFQASYQLQEFDTDFLFYLLFVQKTQHTKQIKQILVPISISASFPFERNRWRSNNTKINLYTTSSIWHTVLQPPSPAPPMKNKSKRWRWQDVHLNLVYCIRVISGLV